MKSYQTITVPLPPDPALLSPLPPVQKPRKTVVPIATGLAWGIDPNFTYQEKLDGRFETRRVRGIVHPLGETVLAGEYLRGEFYAFDLLQLHGEDFRGYPLDERLQWLGEVFQCEPVDCTGGIARRVQSAANGGELLRAVLVRGGEGVVRKSLSAPWGTVMEACKRSQNFYCVVTGIGPGQSVEISRLESAAGVSLASQPPPLDTRHSTLSPCGRVKLGGGKCDHVRIGSILKLTAFGLTDRGMLREPRPDADSVGSWLVKY